MERVLGVGGVFFRAQDPAALAQWYADALGVALAPSDMSTPPWHTEAGICVFAPFASDTDYFPSTQQVMVNFRVADLDAMLAQLKALGVVAFNHSEMEGVGRFAHIHDPEGNAVELWEPAAPPAGET